MDLLCSCKTTLHINELLVVIGIIGVWWTRVSDFWFVRYLLQILSSFQARNMRVDVCLNVLAQMLSEFRALQ